jgi:ATP synthase protein I
VQSPLRVTGWQVLASLAAALLWALGRGETAGWSALAGGAICFVPGGLFALRLARASAKQDGYVFAFFTGEAIKILLSIALFAVAALGFGGVDWLALLVTYIAVVQIYVFGLAAERSSGSAGNNRDS